jgi:hypothetical protein
MIGCDSWSIYTPGTIGRNEPPPIDYSQFRRPSVPGNIVKGQGGSLIRRCDDYLPPGMLLDRYLTMDLKDDIDNGRLRVRIFGKVWYDDVFGHHHWTEYCYESRSADGFSGCEGIGQKIDEDSE